MRDDRGDEVIQRQGQVDPVEDIVVSCLARGVVDASTEIIEIASIFPLTAFFLSAAAGVEGIVHFVQRAVRIEPFAFEQLFFRLFDENLHAVELPVTLRSDGKRFAARTAAPVVGLE